MSKRNTVTMSKLAIDLCVKEKYAFSYTMGRNLLILCGLVQLECLH